MTQIFLVAAQFLLIFYKNDIEYAKLSWFQALKWGTVCFCTYLEAKDVQGANKKMDPLYNKLALF